MTRSSDEFDLFCVIFDCAIILSISSWSFKSLCAQYCDSSDSNSLTGFVLFDSDCLGVLKEVVGKGGGGIRGTNGIEDDVEDKLLDEIKGLYICISNGFAFSLKSHGKL